MNYSKPRAFRVHSPFGCDLWVIAYSSNDVLLEGYATETGRKLLGPPLNLDGIDFGLKFKSLLIHPIQFEHGHIKNKDPTSYLTINGKKVDEYEWKEVNDEVIKAMEEDSKMHNVAAAISYEAPISFGASNQKPGVEDSNQEEVLVSCKHNAYGGYVRTYKRGNNTRVESVGVGNGCNLCDPKENRGFGPFKFPAGASKLTVTPEGLSFS
jgi:hypothetical protein